ncbi:CDP-alcohol phosphatidyltransferase family protein [Candidatus Entotheonella palauensis]|uniref:CDP-alcohol phosphatidyltransferase family protein n=1 Tax=Candidatus Entotheonella palauensis TaxID=93172 RepID=UPI000B7ED35C|nr:CDP-alcohol phosphatidyltransferase family protein [Candidatus Entotheonella palauensis]
MHTHHTNQGILFLADQQNFMTDIARVSVLRRALLNGAKAGIDTWLILTYADPDIVRAHLAGEPRFRQIAFDIVNLNTMTPETLRAQLPQGEIIAISCTALFDAQTLLALQDRSSPAVGVQPSCPQAALHVHLRDGHQVIPAATTSQATHAAVGLLRCDRALLTQAIEGAWDAMSTAADPLTSVITELLTIAKAVNALDVSSYLWLPLGDLSEDGLSRAETQLLQRLGRDGDSPIVRLIARRLSRAVTHKLIHTRIRPNHVTLVSGTIGICGALCLAQPSVDWQVLGSLLFLLSTVIDGCDGELARLTFQESAFGAKLDVTMDNVVHGVLFPAIALGLYREQQQSIYLLLGALALGGVLFSMWVFLPHVLRPSSSRTRETRLHESLASRDFAYILPFLAIFHLLHWFLWATVIGSYAFASAWLVLRRRQPA